MAITTTSQPPVSNSYAGLIQTISNGTNSISVNTYNNQPNTYYSKLYKYMTYGVFLFLSAFLGWNAGTFIGEMINYFRGRGSWLYSLYSLVISYVTYLALKYQNYVVYYP